MSVPARLLLPYSSKLCSQLPWHGHSLCFLICIMAGVAAVRVFRPRASLEYLPADGSLLPSALPSQRRFSQCTWLDTPRLTAPRRSFSPKCDITLPYSSGAILSHTQAAAAARNLGQPQPHNSQTNDPSDTTSYHHYMPAPHCVQKARASLERQTEGKKRESLPGPLTLLDGSCPLSALT